MYSLMSSRIIASSVSNSCCARALQSSVFPTPVGPRNMKLARGRLGSDRPARLLCMASATAVTASSCPTTRWCRRSPRVRMRSISDWSIFCTGTPLHLDTTSAMSSGTTSSRIRDMSPSSPSAACNSLCRSYQTPYRKREASSRLYSRSACAAATLTSSIFSLIRLISARDCFSLSQRSFSSTCLFFSVSTWSSRSEMRAELLARISLFAGRLSDSSSISYRNKVLSTSSSSIGLLVACDCTFEAASSTRSMALSGRKRSAIYRSESLTASIRESSEMRTLWKSSYFSQSPRRIDMVSSGVGSSTITCWNRRSNAASFSIYCRYSSTVVAPMHRSSPLASMGLRRLPASIPESPAFPAPTIVWISSIKRIMVPSSLTSLITALSLSSNSPRYFAPAISWPRSRLKTLRPIRAAGTSPSAMR
mmetsp:Transcript_31777/g.51626  ORF Transcript_31777/g.51626 Transcript_31777/m.51626 type:complete len:421 (-) Transcript_31777:1056-2318(-)